MSGIYDANLTQKYIAQINELSENQIFAAYTDSNGEVNIFDATLIQKYAADYFSAFCVDQGY